MEYESPHSPLPQANQSDGFIREDTPTPTSVCGLRRASAQRKTYNVTMKAAAHRAKPWFCVLFLQCIMINVGVYLAMITRGVIEKLILILILCGLFGDFVWALCFFLTEPLKSGSPILVLVIVNLAITLPHAALTSLILKQLFQSRDISIELHVGHFLTLLLHCCLEIITAIFLKDLKLMWCVVVIGTLYTTYLAYSVIITFSIAIVPVVMLTLLLEACYKLVLCQACCDSQGFKEIVHEYKYQPYYYQARTCASSKCMICLQGYTEDDIIVVLGCHPSHVFHEQCICEWFAQQPACPACRATVSFANL